MLHPVMKVRCWLPLLALVACDTPELDTGLLSASRISLEERQTTRIHVAVATIDDFTFDAPQGITIVPLTDGVGAAFDVTATCDAAHGSDADLVVGVHERGGRDASLVIAVTDDASEACAATVSMWIEPCDLDASCDVPCTPGSVPPATAFALAKAQSARVCVTAEALDSARPLAKELLSIEPATSGFVQGTTMGATRSIIVRGADWLVGPYQIRYEARAGAIATSAIAQLDLGATSDVGIEVVGSAGFAAVQEFARTTIPITVHRYPGSTPTCTLRVESMGTASVCFGTNAKLYAADGTSVDRCVSMPCGDEPHASFTLAYVPQIGSAAVETLPLEVNTGAALTNANVVLDVISRAEDMSCPGADRLACADVDGDGTLEVIASGPANTCLFSLPAWRQQAQTVPARYTSRFLAVPQASPKTPEILAIDGAGDVEHLVRTQLVVDSWQWMSRVTGKAVPQDAIAIRSGTSGPPNFLVGTIPGSPATARFVPLSGLSTGGDVPLGRDGNVAVGALTTISGTQRLGIVSLEGAVASTPALSLLDIDWTTSPPKAGTLTTSVQTGLPAGFRYAVAGRSTLGGDDILVNSYEGAFASGVSELTSYPPVVTRTYGAVRSIAAMPDGSVLLGAAGGAQQTEPGPIVTYRAIDPVPQTVPDSSYGDVIVPCLAADGSSAGFVVRTSADQFRAAQFGIVPQVP
jgi:hypothetical protein